MTLINQMLRDLEQQKKRSPDNAAKGLNATGDVVQRKPAGRHTFRAFSILSVGALLTGGFWVARDMDVSQTLSARMEASESKAPNVVASMPVPVAPVTPVAEVTPVKEIVPLADVVAQPMVTAEQQPPADEPIPLVAPKNPPLVMEAIDWKINKQAMAMRFRLPAKINYEVVVDDKKNIVTLTFPHTVFGGDKPLILLENEFADKVEKIQDGDFLQVKAYLKPNIAISSVDYSLDTKKPTLVMSLSRNY